MENYVTGNTIRNLREKKHYTQKQLADLLMVSDKAVSKWETGKGLPDVSLLEPLAKALGVSVAELMSGECMENRNRSGNMTKGHFYVCPVCGNIIYAVGAGCYSCCGITLPAQEAEPAEDDHGLHVEKMEMDYFLSMEHPMTKDHYISFFAYVTANQVRIVKLYPEQNPETRFPIGGHGFLYAFCNRHNLFVQRV